MGCYCNFAEKRARFFRGLARVSTAMPCVTILLCFLVAVGMGVGVMNITPESRTLKQYVPQDSQSHRDVDQAAVYFPSLTLRQETIILYSEKEANVLTPDAVRFLWEVRSTLMAAKSSAGDAFADVCTPAEIMRDDCAESSFLNFFDFNETAIQELATDDDVLAGINGYADTLMRSGRLGRMSYTSLMGEYSAAPDGSVTSAAAMSFSLSAKDTDAALEWELAAMEAIRPMLESLNDNESLGSGVRLTHEFARQLDDDTAQSSSDDIMLISLTFTIMCTFLCIYMSISWEKERPEMGSIWMGWMGILTVGFSVIFSIGLVSAIGVIYPDIASIFPFLLLGIGVDDSIIIVNEFRRVPITMKPRDRVIETMGRTGSMVALTSMTDFFAFLSGIFTVFPAVSSFCTYMAVGVAIDWIFQNTFFPACLTIEARRQYRAHHEGPVWGGKSSGCCDRFLRWLSQHVVRCADLAHAPGDLSKSDLEAEKATDLEAERATEPTGKASDASIEGHVSDEDISNYKPNAFLRFLLHPATATILAAVYVAATILAGFGAVNVEQGLDTGLLSPKGAVMHDYNWARNNLFGNSGLPVAMVFLNNNNPSGLPPNELYRSPDSLDAINALTSYFIDTGNYLDLNISYADPLAQQDETVSLSRFLTGAQFYVQDMGMDSSDVWSLEYPEIITAIENEEGPGAVKATIFMDIPFAGREGAQESKRIVLETREYLDGYNDGSHEVLVTDSTLIYFEQYIAIFSETMRNLLLALCAVFLSAVVLTCSWQTAIFGTIAVASVDLWLFGLMYALDVSLDSVSSIILIMSIGLAADYVMHVVFDIFHPYDKRFTRMCPTYQVAHGLEHAGLAVMTGGFTTFIAFVPTAFSQSHIFTTFFRLLCGTTTFGLLHGLVFGPVFILLFISLARLCFPVKEPIGKNVDEVTPSTDRSGVELASAPSGGVAMASTDRSGVELASAPSGGVAMDEIPLAELRNLD